MVFQISSSTHPSLWPAQQQSVVDSAGPLQFELLQSSHGSSTWLVQTQQHACRGDRAAGAHCFRRSTAAAGSGRGGGARQAAANPLQSFAVLSGSRLFGINHAGSIRHTFNQIDVERKGHITEADLAVFAESHNLPQGYVRPFLAAVLQHQQEQQGFEQAALPHEEQEGVSFDAFHAFVQSRESSLRQAFDAFDIDGDGRISPEDLCCSLSRVAICSPSGCVMRPRGHLVAELLARLNVEPARRLTFPEFRSFFMLLPEQEQLVEYWLSGPAALSCADMGCHFSIQDCVHRQRKGSPWGHLLAGAVAGAASRTATAPLETLRLAAMAGHIPAGCSLVSAGQQLVAAGGMRALYKGNLINVLRSAPARAVDFFAFDLFKTWVGSDTYAKTFTAAGLAGTFSWMLLYPLEVVRSRLTLGAGAYRGIGHCVSSMLAVEGPGAFYRGLGASVAAIAPEAAITYGLHDMLKRAYGRQTLADPGIVPSLLCGVVASWSGQLVAFPLETVSRRLQVAGAAAAAAAASGGTARAAAATASATAVATGAAAVAAAGHSGGGGVLGVLTQLLQEGGPRALYRGFGAATLRIVPSAFISFGAYELIQRLWLELEAKQDVKAALSHYQRLRTALQAAHRCNQALQQQAIEGGSVGAVPECVPCRLEVQELVLSGCSSCDAAAAGSSCGSSSGNGSSSKGSGSVSSCLSGCGSSSSGGAAAVGQAQKEPAAAAPVAAAASVPDGAAAQSSNGSIVSASTGNLSSSSNSSEAYGCSGSQTQQPVSACALDAVLPSAGAKPAAAAAAAAGRSAGPSAGAAA